MREALALVRASWLSALSYRISMVLSLAGLLFTVVPVYFVTNALQPVMEESIAAEGEQYFAFVLIGMIAFNLLSEAVYALPNAIRGGIATGTLEALLSTPSRLPTLLAGMSGYEFLWMGIRCLILFLAGWILGAQYAWHQVLTAAVILFLITLAYLPFGLVAAAMVLAFRTTGPLQQGVLVMSTLLGGVYYPTTVIPSWIQYLSNVVPLTYGLRALRQTLLEGLPLHAVAEDLAILSAFVVGLLTAGTWLFLLALRYARRSGTLAQY